MVLSLRFGLVCSLAVLAVATASGLRSEATVQVVADPGSEADVAKVQWNNLWKGSAPGPVTRDEPEETSTKGEPKMTKDMQTKLSLAAAAILAGVILVAVAIEAGKSFARSKVSDILMLAFNALCREIAVLGTLALLGYAVIESGVLIRWAEGSFTKFDDRILQELFEHVEFYICVMALFYVAQGAILLTNAFWVTRKWHNFEVTTIDTTVFAYIRAVRERKRNAIRLIDVSARRRHLTDVERIEFAVMRRDFMRPRLADLPLDSDFRFSEYLAAVLSRTLASVLEVPVAAWLVIEALFIFMRVLMGTSIVVQIVVFTVSGYAMMALQVWLYRTLHTVYRSTAGDAPTLHEMAEVIQARGHEVQEAEGGAALMEELIAIFLHPSRLVPAALLQPVQHRVKNGALYSRLTPQQALFPFGDKGPQYLLFLIRLCAFFVATYSALIAVTMVSVTVAALGPAAAAVSGIFMAIPPLFMALNLGRVLELFAVVTSLEDLRDDELVHRTLQRQFAQQERSARTLLSALAVRQTVGKAEDEDRETPVEIDTALRAAFNSVDREKKGHVEHEDLGVLLQRVGLAVTHGVLSKLVEMADTEKSGKITFESFRRIALRIMEARVDVRKTVRLAFTTFTDTQQQTFADGKLTAEPFHELVREAVGDRLDTEAVDFLFRDADDDEDGYVTWEQFASLMLAHANRGVLYERGDDGESGSYDTGSDYDSRSDSGSQASSAFTSSTAETE